MAEENVVPTAFGRLSRWRTPVVAIAFTTAISAGLILTGDLGALADTTVLLLLGVFIAVNASVLILRRDPVEHDHFQVPAPIPVLGIAACVLVMSQVEGETWLRAGALLLLGLVLWAVERAVVRSRRPARAT
jgi:amino acid transporter